MQMGDDAMIHVELYLYMYTKMKLHFCEVLVTYLLYPRANCCGRAQSRECLHTWSLGVDSLPLSPC